MYTCPLLYFIPLQGFSEVLTEMIIQSQVHVIERHNTMQRLLNFLTMFLTPIYEMSKNNILLQRCRSKLWEFAKCSSKSKRKITNEFSRGKQTIISFWRFLQDITVELQKTGPTSSSCNPFPSWPFVSGQRHLLIASLHQHSVVKES